mmetsp:Transcript_4976/g.7110  ORF Transcript_4976/g.7110 Transcript_4976/m.7110 type:complete len:223 (+) Transcript_4976:2-670(+)
MRILLLFLLLSRSLGFPFLHNTSISQPKCAGPDIKKTIFSSILSISLLIAPFDQSHAMIESDNIGASSVSDSKLLSGAASTLDTGSRKIITRGVNLENADFHGKDMSGVSFQQSLVRGSNFVAAKLVGAGFFDADLSNCNFTGANMSQTNLEMSNLKGAVLKNAIIKEAYVSGATKMEPKDIEGADFSDTYLRKDQLKYLCSMATGTNPVTGIDTAESLNCP